MTQDEKKKQDNLKNIEQLQVELLSNPKSVRFSQLADLYLNENMITEAFELLTKSLKYHPTSISGHLLMGKALQLQKKYSESVPYFNFVTEKAPTNWMSFLLRAESLLKMNSAKQALKDFKTVLLHNPNHSLSRKAVAKLEVLTADDYDDGVFEMKQLKDLPPIVSEQVTQHDGPMRAMSSKTDILAPVPTTLNRVLSLIDAFIVRHDYDKAIRLLKEARAEYGEHQEINHRQLKLSQYENAQKIRPKVDPHVSISRQHLIAEKKLKALELLLRRIREYHSRPLES